MSIVNEFNEYRERMNDVILSKGNLVMKRLWNLDTIWGNAMNWD